MRKKNYFNLNLKHYRMIQKLTQKELAKKSNISQQNVSILESNNRMKSPTLDTIIKLCKALDICPYGLLQHKCENCNRYHNCNLYNELQNHNYDNCNIEYDI